MRASEFQTGKINVLDEGIEPSVFALGLEINLFGPLPHRCQCTHRVISILSARLKSTTAPSRDTLAFEVYTVNYATTNIHSPPLDDPVAFIQSIRSKPRVGFSRPPRPYRVLPSPRSRRARQIERAHSIVSMCSLPPVFFPPSFDSGPNTSAITAPVHTRARILFDFPVS